MGLTFNTCYYAGICLHVKRSFLPAFLGSKKGAGNPTPVTAGWPDAGAQQQGSADGQAGV
tara:strand:- start:65 stop:244 length:180 start_codon:yes stop_codon:yes gene_type:complete